MITIKLDRGHNILHIAKHDKDLFDYVDVTVIYNVTHVTHQGDGWYDIHHGKRILGHVTDVESVKETW